MIIPEVKVAVIGGSSILGSGFPEAFEDVDVIIEGAIFETPFGPAAPFTYASVDGIEFLLSPSMGSPRRY